MADVIVQLGGKTQAWVNANPNYVLEERQHLYILDGANAGQYYIGDGSTPLSGLTLYGASGGGVWGAITGTLSNQTDLQNALNAKLNASEKSTSADQVVITNGSNVLTSLSLGASQSIRRNAANNAFEAYTPSSGSSVIAKSTVTSAVHTGTLTNTLIHSELIPANSFTTGDIIEYMVCNAKTTANGFTIRVYVNTSATLVGATQISTYGAGTSAGVYFHSRIANIVSPTNTEMYPVTTSFLGRDALVAGVNISSVNIDWTVDQYIIVAHQLSNIVDSTTFRSLYVLKR